MRSSRIWARAAIAAAALALLGVAIRRAGFGDVARADPAVPAPVATPDAGAPAAPAPKRAESTTVRIIMTVIPSNTKATVAWGKKRLGIIAPHQPLVIQRPRDSGPLDLVVRGENCVPVQTRAYTFADNKIAVKLTPLDQKNTLLGYREELPPDGGAPNPDGGALP